MWLGKGLYFLQRVYAVYVCRVAVAQVAAVCLIVALYLNGQDFKFKFPPQGDDVTKMAPPEWQWEDIQRFLGRSDEKVMCRTVATVHQDEGSGKIDVASNEAEEF